MYKVEVNRVLIPVDFSDPARKAFYVGLKFAQIFGADTWVLHVEEPLNVFHSDYEDLERLEEEVKRLEKGIRRRLDELFEEGQVDALLRRRVQLAIRGGKPWLEIVRFAAEKDVDLIVMATHGRTGLKHMLIGSTAERVVRRSPCMVLSVKPDDYDPGIEKLLAT